MNKAFPLSSDNVKFLSNMPFPRLNLKYIKDGFKSKENVISGGVLEMLTDRLFGSF